MKYGIGIRDITPTRSVMLHGYGGRIKRSDGVTHPLRAADEHGTSLLHGYRILAP